MLSLTAACFGDSPARYIYDGGTYIASCVVVQADRLGETITLDEGPYVASARTITGVDVKDGIALTFTASPCDGKPPSAWFLYTSIDLTPAQERDLVKDVSR
jgi:hypothetical protein